MIHKLWLSILPEAYQTKCLIVKGFRSHQVCDPLVDRGSCDLTADVDFAALKHIVSANGKFGNYIICCYMYDYSHTYSRGYRIVGKLVNEQHFIKQKSAKWFHPIPLANSKLFASQNHTAVNLPLKLPLTKLSCFPTPSYFNSKLKLAIFHKLGF